MSFAACNANLTNVSTLASVRSSVCPSVSSISQTWVSGSGPNLAKRCPLGSICTFWDFWPEPRAYKIFIHYISIFVGFYPNERPNGDEWMNERPRMVSGYNSISIKGLRLKLSRRCGYGSRYILASFGPDIGHKWGSFYRLVDWYLDPSSWKWKLAKH